CDANSATLETARKACPGIQVTSDFEAVLRDETVDAVAIASPAVQHAEMAEAALRAGKDVFVEKPLALRYRDGEKLAQLSQMMGRVLMVGHLLEYHPAILKLKALIDDGEIGDIRYIYSHRLNLGRVRKEENILWSFAPHDISVILR